MVLYSILIFKNFQIVLFVCCIIFHKIVTAEHNLGFNKPCRNRCAKMGNISLEYMNKGNKLFLENKIKSALSYYIRGGEMIVDNVDILENVAECYSKLGYHYRVLDQAHSILGKEPPFCFLGVYYKVTALLGLQRFKEAILYISTLMSLNDDLQKSKDLVNILKRLHALEYQQRTGIFDMREMLDLYLSDKFDNVDYADYVGPVKIVNIPGKWRGLVATKDINAGQLLILNKAFAIAYQEDINDKKWSDFDELVELVADKLRVEPEHANWFYQSFAGPAMTFLSRFVGNDTVDYRRIRGIMYFTSTTGDRNGIVPSSRNRRGVWILPAYINHDGFDSNSFWVLFRDIMVVRAIKPILKGEEITVSYMEPDSPFEHREHECKQHGFQCSCSLCQIDRNDSVHVREERMRIYKEMSQPALSSGTLLSFVEQLEDLRPNNPELNVYLITPLLRIGFNYHSAGKFREEAEILTRAHRIIKNSALATIAVKCSLTILNSYITLGNRKKILEWIEIIKEDLVAAYGSVEVFKLIGLRPLKSLHKLGISFY